MAMVSTEIHISALLLVIAVLWLLSLLFTVFYFRKVLKRERKLKDGMGQILNFTEL